MEAEQKFIKGFNAGYLLAKHNPQLSWILNQGVQENENPLVQGFLAGTLEYGREKLKEQMNSYPKDRQGYDRDR